MADRKTRPCRAWKKRICALCLALGMALSLCSAAQAEDRAAALTFELFCDGLSTQDDQGVNQVTVQQGDVITVSFRIDTDKATDLSTVRNSIYYDHKFFTLVTEEDWYVDPRFSASPGISITGNEYVQVSSDRGLGLSANANVVVATAKLQVTADSGESTIACTNCQAYQLEEDTYSEIPVVERNLHVSIGAPQGQTFTVSYHTDGGPLVADSETVASGESVTLPEPTRDGYQFAYWTLNGAEYAAGDSYTPKSNVTFTAVWTPAQDANTFIAEGTEQIQGILGLLTRIEAQEDGTVKTIQTTSQGVTGITVTDGDDNVLGETAAVPADVAALAQRSGEPVTLPLEVSAAKSSGQATVIALSVPQEAGQVKVEIPVAEITPGAVALLVQTDGTEQLVQTCVITELGVALSVEGDVRVKIVDNGKNFADVGETYWGRDAITFVTARSIFNGTGTDTFAPETPMDRGMLVQVLYNLEGAPAASGTASFPDVSGSAWYAAAVNWAVANGVASGYGDGSFGPEDSITREQLAVMLWRYAGSPEATQTTLDFPDGDQVSGYARAALLWANEKGIINGTGSGTLSPQGPATRAQVAQVMWNFLTNA